VRLISFYKFVYLMPLRKIYFAGSIRAGRGDADLYRQLIGHLRQYGEVLTEHIGHDGLTPDGEATLTDREIYERDLGWLLSSDVVVAEVTIPSLGVGFEIARAVEAGKRVLCLFRPGGGRRLSAMVAGCAAVEVIEYSEPNEALGRIDEFLGS
jgi:2'-deoxynucleoside 5'-phosphate N-hydrolase